MVAKFTNEVKILLKKEVIMEIRHSVHPDHAKHFTSDDLIKNFLVKSLFKRDEINLVYSHIDRIIVGGINPIDKELALKAGKEIGVNYFLERREMGIINIAGSGIIKIDGEKGVLTWLLEYLTHHWSSTAVGSIVLIIIIILFMLYVVRGNEPKKESKTEG